MPEANEHRAEVIARELVERYYQSIRVFFTHRGFSTEDSEDLAQETFLRAYRNIDSLRDPSSARPWLFAVATNVFRNEVRSRRAEKRQELEMPVELTRAGPDPEVAEWTPLPESPADLEAILARERSELVASAMRDLPPRMRRAVMMRIGQGLKYREIAAAMQVSIETVKPQLGQARERLRRQLGEQFADLEKE